MRSINDMWFENGGESLHLVVVCVVVSKQKYIFQGSQVATGAKHCTHILSPHPRKERGKIVTLKHKVNI